MWQWGGCALYTGPRSRSGCHWSRATTPDSSTSSGSEHYVICVRRTPYSLTPTLRDVYSSLLLLAQSFCNSMLNGFVCLSTLILPVDGFIHVIHDRSHQLKLQTVISHFGQKVLCRLFHNKKHIFITCCSFNVVFQTKWFVFALSAVIIIKHDYIPSRIDS